jgi:hypothetical protein
MKFLVMASFRFEEGDTWPEKEAVFRKAMEEHSERFPDFPVGLPYVCEHHLSKSDCYLANR